MSYIVFARKWRPQGFDKVVGQEHVTTTLKNAISLNRIAHAYLFAGPRGIGKTTIARIFARALNCERGPTENPCSRCVSCKEIILGNSVDVLEIDGASNRGIDEIRSLRENIKFSPISGRFKIYIIDEMHQITPDAFNALLKTLEEPPAHAKFIFATTQPHKVPATILSRCQRFDFRRIPVKLIIDKLSQIIKEEKIRVEEGVLFAIARAAEGSMRDAEVLIDQLNCATEGKVNMKDVTEMLGVIEEDLLFDIAEKIKKRETRELLLLLDKIISAGKDLTYLLASLIEHFRNLLVSKVVKTGLEDILDLPSETLTKISQQAQDFSQAELFYILQILTHTQDMAKRAISVHVAVELAIIKMTEREQLISVEEILNKINQFKNGLPPENNATRNSPKSSNPPKEVNQTTRVPEVAKKEVHIENKEIKKKKVNLDEVKTVWARLIEEVQKYKTYYGIYLSEGKLLAVEDNVLSVGFSKDKNLNKETLDNPLIRQTIESKLGELLQAEVRLNFVILKEEPQENIEPSVNLQENSVQKNQRGPSAEEKSSKVDPMEEKLVRIFGGKIVK